MADLTLATLPEALADRGINPEAYRLSGGLPNETYCIDRDGVGSKKSAE